MTQVTLRTDDALFQVLRAFKFPGTGTTMKPLQGIDTCRRWVVQPKVLASEERGLLVVAHSLFLGMRMAAGMSAYHFVCCFSSLGGRSNYIFQGCPIASIPLRSSEAVLPKCLATGVCFVFSYVTCFTLLHHLRSPMLSPSTFAMVTCPETE